MTYTLSLLAPARRDLEHRLPEGVAAAAWEFIRGPLLEDPHKVGKPLRNERKGLWSARRGQYRVIYRILDDLVVVEVCVWRTVRTSITENRSQAQA